MVLKSPISLDVLDAESSGKEIKMEKDKFLALAGVEYDKWLESQKGQTDAYEYEKSFSDLMDRIAVSLLQGSVGKVPDDKRKKNDND